MKGGSVGITQVENLEVKTVKLSTDGKKNTQCDIIASEKYEILTFLTIYKGQRSNRG